MLETWTTPRTGTVYRWSLWAEGSRVAMGGPHPTLEEAEAEALRHCDDSLKRRPDRITRL